MRTKHRNKLKDAIDAMRRRGSPFVEHIYNDETEEVVCIEDLKALLDDSPDDGVLQVTLTGKGGWYNLHFDNIRVIIPNSCPLEVVRLMPVDNK